jgi:hypothetical protein
MVEKEGRYRLQMNNAVGCTILEVAAFLNFCKNDNQLFFPSTNFIVSDFLDHL